MGYSYTLSFTTFQADDNVACLKAIREAEPEIGDYMEIVEDEIASSFILTTQPVNGITPKMPSSASSKTT